MRFSKLGKIQNKKRGISSIVGGVFFLVLMVTGFTVYFLAIDSQARMIDTQQIIADIEVAKIREKFVVAATSDPGDNNRLSLQVVNTGSNPVEIADIWIVNKTDADQPATRYEIDYVDVHIPIGSSDNILTNTALYLDPEIYAIKVISTMGTIATVEYDVNGGSNILNAQMVAIPQDVRFGENVTVSLIVTNIGDSEINAVTANTLDVNPNQCRDPPNPIFIGPTDLSSSQSTMFFWDCILDPPIGNLITFTADATGQLSGVPIDSNFASDSVIVRDFASGGSGEEIVIKEELFGKPQLYMTFPNPIGKVLDDEVLFGVNIANPTDQSIYVSKVVMMAISPRATSSDKIWNAQCEGNTPSPVTVPPTTDKWTCPETNQLVWSDTSTPQEIPPRSVFPFNVILPTGDLGGSMADAMNVLIQPVVFSTLGQYAKAGYGSTQHSDQVALPNVYLTTVLESTSPSDIVTSMNGIVSGSTIILSASIADMDADTTYGINAGSRLIINIPREWTYNSIVSSSGFDPPVVETFPDGSHQIRATLSANLLSGAKTIQFSVDAPLLTSTKLYVMHVLADGTATGLNGPSAFNIGPISEVVFQVCATGGCP